MRNLRNIIKTKLANGVETLLVVGNLGEISCLAAGDERGVDFPLHESPFQLYRILQVRRPEGFMMY